MSAGVEKLNISFCYHLCHPAAGLRSPSHYEISLEELADLQCCSISLTG